MGFFDSDIVRSEMTKISELQEDIYKSVFAFSTMGREERLKHVELLQDLLNTQRVLYTRISLSDDPEAVQMKEQIMMTAQMMGLSKGADMNTLFKNMEAMIGMMKSQIDRSGSDL